MHNFPSPSQVWGLSVKYNHNKTLISLWTKYFSCISTFFQSNAHACFPLGLPILLLNMSHLTTEPYRWGYFILGHNLLKHTGHAGLSLCWSFCPTVWPPKLLFHIKYNIWTIQLQIKGQTSISNYLNLTCIWSRIFFNLLFAPLSDLLHWDFRSDAGQPLGDHFCELSYWKRLIIPGRDWETE